MSYHTLTFSRAELQLIVSGLRVRAARDWGSAQLMRRDNNSNLANLCEYHETNSAASYELSERLYGLAWPQTDDEGVES